MKKLIVMLMILSPMMANAKKVAVLAEKAEVRYTANLFVPATPQSLVNGGQGAKCKFGHGDCASGYSCVGGYGCDKD